MKHSELLIQLTIYMNLKWIFLCERIHTENSDTDDLVNAKYS